MARLYALVGHGSIFRPSGGTLAEGGEMSRALRAMGVLLLLSSCARPGRAAPDLPQQWAPAEIELTRVPPYASSDHLFGRVHHVEPSDFNVAVFISVGG